MTRLVISPRAEQDLREIGIYIAEDNVNAAISLPQLLAMKLSAWRDDVDVADARRILRELTGEYDEVWKSVAPFLVPGDELKAQYAFSDLWESLHNVKD